MQVVVAKVDADKHRDLAQRFGVSGFPTLKFFASGEDKEAVACVAQCNASCNAAPLASLASDLRPCWLPA